jgi:hypothetical protein
MATIKSYTDLEQSKKLAEILPLETADMCFVNDGTAIKIDANSYNVRKHMWKDEGVQLIPCWSLALLLDVIPQEIFDGEYIINITEGCDNRWVLTYDHFENRNHSYYSLSIGADTLVDACVAMIEKIHELRVM